MFNPMTNNPLLTALACAALQPALRSLLIFDAPPAGLQQVANILQRFTEQTSGLPVEQATIGISGNDDDLWGSRPLPVSGEQGLSFVFHPQLFSPQRNAGHIQLFLIPDLTRLSLAAIRSCVMLIGTNLAHLERNEQSATWQPQYIWLASCRQNDIGSISPHLLDRFALRLTWDDPLQSLTQNHQSRVDELIQSINQSLEITSPAQATGLLEHLQRAAGREIELTAAALERVLDYSDPQQLYPRRELALARCAIALGQLMGDTHLSSWHVDRAADLLGVQQEMADPTKPLPAANEPATNEASVIERAPTDEENSTGSTTASESKAGEPVQNILVPIQEEQTLEMIDMPIVSANNPYLEDVATSTREIDSLRVPYRRFSTGRSDRGPIYGVEASESLEDLALISTLLMAARFRKIRQSKRSGLHIKLEDLRRYRRERMPEEMLLVLLDYTSIRDSQWDDALLPFLSEAYVQRAAIAIIKVGAQDTSSALRAELVEARSILVPRIGLTLETPAGRATPLAHGLDIALQTLHRVLQHGRSAVQRVTFVVISDGRGNVPLDASRRNEQPTLVTREGIDDALRVAQAIRAVNRVEKILLNPQPPYYPDLPRRLADALGAHMQDIPPLPMPLPGQEGSR